MTPVPAPPALARVCRGACGLSLPATAYHSNGGKQRWECALCYNARQRARYHADPTYRAAIAARDRKSNAARAGKRSAYSVAYRQAHLDECRRRDRLRSARLTGQRNADSQDAGGFALYENAAGRIYHLPCGVPLPRGKAAVERWGYWGEGSDDKPIWRRVK